MSEQISRRCQMEMDTGQQTFEEGHDLLKEAYDLLSDFLLVP